MAGSRMLRRSWNKGRGIKNVASSCHKIIGHIEPIRVHFLPSKMFRRFTPTAIQIQPFGLGITFHAVRSHSAIRVNLWNLRISLWPLCLRSVRCVPFMLNPSGSDPNTLQFLMIGVTAVVIRIGSHFLHRAIFKFVHCSHNKTL